MVKKLALTLLYSLWTIPSFGQLPTTTPVFPVNAQWVTDKGSQVYNAKAYGATGNGTTDDTAAILATISAAGVGGVILFPPGSYSVSSQIQITANNQVVYGYGATLKCNQTTATDCFMTGSTSNPNLIDIYQLPA